MTQRGDRWEGSEQARRIGLNEAVFREVNERLEDLEARFGVEDDQLDLICECCDANCVERIRVGRAAYEAVRSDPQLFVIYPGHELGDVETVVEATPAYHIVKKRPGEPARVAQATNPRA
jgi:hypothetical protein